MASAALRPARQRVAGGAAVTGAAAGALRVWRVYNGSSSLQDLVEL